MLYLPGRHLGGASAAPASSGVCEDATNVIADWDPEVLTVVRSTADYSTPIPVVTWAAVGTFTGDWQPASGRIERQEMGRKVKSEAFVIAPCDLDVVAGDKLQRADGSFMYVNYVRVFKGHTTIYLTATEGQN